MATSLPVFRHVLTTLRRYFPSRRLIRSHKNIYAVQDRRFPIILSNYALLKIAQLQSKFQSHHRNQKLQLPKSTLLAAEMDPPESVRGMTVLDRLMFKRTVKIPGMKVPVQKVGILKKNLRATMLKMPKIKPIANLSDGDPDKDTHKLFLFDPEKYASYEDLEEDDRQTLADNGVTCSQFEMFSIDLTYENWNVQDIVRAVMPADSESVSGFSTIGHIAHLNLRPEAFPYKKLIGEVIIDKIPGILTVVNKLDVIDTTFRNFKMELLAGEDNYVTRARENGCVYEFDFSKVYWNPRLGTEHARIIKELKKDDTVYDMFAGVGPFAIPAGRRRITVHANDLNPHSYASLQKNIDLNKLVSGTVIPYDMDAREFAKKVIKTDLCKRLGDDVAGDMHVLMNLPASAIEFLDCFVGMLADTNIEDVDETKLPIVHCYCFSKSDDPCKDVQEQGEVILGRSITKDVDVRFVRNVAPNKEMMCLSFRLSRDILFGEVKMETNGMAVEDEEPDLKKQKTS